MVIGTLSELCSHGHSLMLEHFHHPLKKLGPSCRHSPPPALVTTSLLSVSMDSSFLGITDERTVHYVASLSDFSPLVLSTLSPDARRP